MNLSMDSFYFIYSQINNSVVSTDMQGRFPMHGFITPCLLSLDPLNRVRLNKIKKRKSKYVEGMDMVIITKALGIYTKTPFKGFLWQRRGLNDPDSLVSLVGS